MHVSAHALSVHLCMQYVLPSQVVKAQGFQSVSIHRPGLLGQEGLLDRGMKVLLSKIFLSLAVRCVWSLIMLVLCCCATFLVREIKHTAQFNHPEFWCAGLVQLHPPSDGWLESVYNVFVVYGQPAPPQHTCSVVHVLIDEAVLATGFVNSEFTALSLVHVCHAAESKRSWFDLNNSQSIQTTTRIRLCPWLMAPTRIRASIWPRCPALNAAPHTASSLHFTALLPPSAPNTLNL